MEYHNAHRHGRRDRRNATVTAPLSDDVNPDSGTRWCATLVAHQFDTTIEVRETRG
jgi:hypothetical protein